MIISYSIWAAWLLSELLLNRLLRSGGTDKKDRDQGSLRIIWLTIGVANTAGVLSAFYLKAPVSNSPLINGIGLSIIALGVIIRFFSIWSLGRFFTVDVTIRKDHKLKTDGIYGLLRHPSYSGSILSFIGLGFSLNNWISVLAISIPVTIAMLYRINIEEKLLMKQFGSEYSDYMKKTYRLIPWIY